MRGMLAALLALTCLQAAAPARGPDFWRSIAQAGYAVPAGESAAGLLGELDELFAARDPKLRDDLGYGIAEQWILRRRLLAPQEARALTATWTAWLGRGLGVRGTDTVLVRAFAAFLELCREPLDAPGAEFDAQRHAARRNTRNLLRAVHERLLFARELPPQLAEPRAALQELLRAYADGRV